MATGTAGNAARTYDNYQPVYFAKRILFSDDGDAITLGVLPAGSLVIDVGFTTVTAFNDSGTDTFDIGTSGTNDEYASAVTMPAAGLQAKGDNLTTSDAMYLAAATTLVARYNGQNSDATTGEGYAWVLALTNLET